MIRLSDQTAASGDGLGSIAISGLVCEWPDRLTASAWLEHIPFAFWLAQTLRPERFVELGTHTGASFCAFLQAFTALGLTPSASAVDTWRGDAQSGLYDDRIYDDLQAYTAARYGASAELLRMSFDEALPRFADASIDLLHIDGFHSFEAVRHDFETWRPKLSPRGVVLFHDTQVFRDGYGVWQLWQELAATQPHFEFRHGYGLGVAFIGTQRPPALQALADLSGNGEASEEIRGLFAALGARLSARVQLDLQQAAFAEAQVNWNEERERARGEIERAHATILEHEGEIRQQVKVLAEQANILDQQARVLDELGRFANERGQKLDEQAELIAERDRTIAAHRSALTA